MFDTSLQSNAGTEDMIYVQLGATNGDGLAGSPYGSIQKAIDAAPPGATIVVGEGIYNENLVFRNSGTEGAPITLKADGPPGTVVITPKNASLDTIRISGADHIVIDGFTLHGSDDPSRQVLHIHAKNDNTDPASDITISNNVIERGEGDGIKVSKSDGLTIIGNEITGGGDGEAAIDFVGVQGATIANNIISNIPNIGLMIKGGSIGIDIFDNQISEIGRMAVEIGGYTPERFYRPGFLEDGNTFEAANIAFSGNSISEVDMTAIRVIGAQDILLENNTVSEVGQAVTVDDSAKFHDAWFSDSLTFIGNDFPEDWIKDRSEDANIVILTDDANVDVFEDETPDTEAIVESPISEGVVSKDPVNTVGTQDDFVFVPPHPIQIVRAETDLSREPSSDLADSSLSKNEVQSMLFETEATELWDSWF
ncbi:MAG: right-handed parallel beta-helix repeat-containing protein [Yoonia sp.]|uniref:right-handed parallel beta-helix repeat-containing protein n=1 Tax=Yoonia sp. TaxID=2212373 RepID=UPI003EF71640